MEQENLLYLIHNKISFVSFKRVIFATHVQVDSIRSVYNLIASTCNTAMVDTLIGFLLLFHKPKPI